ncbi:MAG: hypothetical protein HC816_02220 [Leptolyngbyaceae cyanobacterium RM1_1_2]|nr:hypothetical protein [Leptolyngbyaceae cyanobacterium RM1_1_2]
MVPLLRWPPLMAAGTRFYQTIANNRKAAGRLTKPFQFQPFGAEPAAAVERVVWGLLGISAIANLYRLMAA